MSEGDKGVLCVIGVMFTLALAMLALGIDVGRGWTRREAAENGAGVYLADGKTGKTSFHWIAP